MKLAVEALACRYPTANYNDGRISILLDGYTIDVYDRGSARLVIAFDFLQNPESSSRERLGWASTFLARRNLSAIHVKPDENCWYRKPQLASFLDVAAELGLFSGFTSVMTYGGSMGGFGALSLAAKCRASDCLAMNPQINLGPAVRSWETRFRAALKQDWTDDLCDIGKQIEGVRTTIVYDHCFDLDCKQVQLVKNGAFTALSIPFVGHNIPSHLQTMKLLGSLFEDCLEGKLNPAAYHVLFRRRRELLRYKNVMLEKARGKVRRTEIIKNALMKATLGVA